MRQIILCVAMLICSIFMYALISVLENSEENISLTGWNNYEIK
ncbi:hypothetical protein EDC17_10143 [Sphingobacterium alimentarium]|uniref:Uncharacterized protein n=1 Tax=Sphingobacterium alimentarium TaxID=797292 RepID=A0A4R3VXB4_9SPHI|nr:hypothetical protein EDC17_10143 [Sphingobacterium alimentarium]